MGGTTQQDTSKRSCKELLEATPGLRDGGYVVTPDGTNQIKVYCDMAGGGWTLVGMVHSANNRAVKEPSNFFNQGYQSTAKELQTNTNAIGKGVSTGIRTLLVHMLAVLDSRPA